MKNRQIQSYFRLIALLVALTSTIEMTWGETTYYLKQVTSVTAGGMYVFEQTYNEKYYAMNNSIDNKAVTTITSYKNSGLAGTESYVWKLETAKGGYYLKNVSLSSSSYLNNTSSTDMSFGSKTSIWAFNFKEDNTVMIQNTSNSNRFLGFMHGGGTVTTRYKAYATGSVNESTYPHAIKVYQLIEGTSLTINSFGYATIASTSALDFSDAETNGYSAWQITDISGTTLSFSQISGAVAAGTGVLLKGSASANIDIPFATSGTDLSLTNKLVGITAATDVAEGLYYGLSGNAFVPVNSGTVPAGKALLPAGEINPVKSYTMVFNSADGISTVENGQRTMDNAGIYNLNGQRLQKMQKGINIVNGKKYIIK